MDPNGTPCFPDCQEFESSILEQVAKRYLLLQEVVAMKELFYGQKKIRRPPILISYV